MLTIETLDRIEGRKVNRANAAALLAGLAARPLGSDQRLAMYLGQTLHESVGLQYDSEIWGPTKAQKGYEGREDLGNTQPGDGYLFCGRGPIQITGRANYRSFTAWCRHYWPNCPDFEDDPDLILTDPWEGLAPLWYWETGNPTRRSLNVYADAGNFEAVTRKVNGGLNGYSDRCNRYTRAALVLLGRVPGDVRGFQADTPGLEVDGIAGTATRAALHAALGRSASSASSASSVPLSAAPAAAPSLLASIVSAIAALFRRNA